MPGQMLKETGLELSDELLELLAAAFFVEMEIGPGLAVGLAAAEAVQDVLPPCAAGCGQESPYKSIGFRDLKSH